MDRDGLHLYETSGYKNLSPEKSSLVLDVVFSGGALMTFSVTLPEPMLINSVSDVYLDSFTTFKQLANTTLTTNNMGFLLKIDQFTIPSYSGTNISQTVSGVVNTSNEINRSIYIPNTASSALTTIHKGGKMNYVCRMNPTRLSAITGTITDMGLKANFGTIGDEVTYASPFSAAGGAGTDPARFIAEFVFVARD